MFVCTLCGCSCGPSFLVSAASVLSPWLLRVASGIQSPRWAGRRSQQDVWRMRCTNPDSAEGPSMCLLQLCDCSRVGGPTVFHMKLVILWWRQQSRWVSGYISAESYFFAARLYATDKRKIWMNEWYSIVVCSICTNHSNRIILPSLHNQRIHNCTVCLGLRQRTNEYFATSVSKCEDNSSPPQAALSHSNDLKDVHLPQNGGERQWWITPWIAHSDM